MNHGWHLESDEPDEYDRLQQLRGQIGKAITHLGISNSEVIFMFIKTHIIYPQSIRDVPTNFSEYDDAFIYNEIRKQLEVLAEANAANAMTRRSRSLFGK